MRRGRNEKRNLERKQSVMRERLLREQEGMMTVEAAVIVPAVSFILVGVVFFFLFFLDI